MNNRIIISLSLIVCSFLSGCSVKVINLNSDSLTTVNREIIFAEDKPASALKLNDQQGDGLAILKEISFETGTIELELKGENKPGKSFVGVAFNIQNDSTYEAIYFRPFNFRSNEKIGREHSIQYISHPKNNWRFLRTNYEGKYEAEYPNPPLPDDWFGIRIKINDKSVHVYDNVSNTELLSIERIEEQKSNKIGLWTGNNSKGEFRNLKILK